MASDGLIAFTKILTHWLERNPGKYYVFREAVGEQFSRVGQNADYRDNQLARLLKDKTGYETRSKLSNVIRAGKSSGGGETDTHIALYYLAKIDETYRRFVSHIELALFGNDKEFFDIFEFCPTRDLIPTIEPATKLGHVDKGQPQRN